MHTDLIDFESDAIDPNAADLVAAIDTARASPERSRPAGTRARPVQ
jgi:hypothetical protein